MKARTTQLKRTPLRRVSKKRQGDMRVYAKKRIAFLAKFPLCQWWLNEHGFGPEDQEQLQSQHANGIVYVDGVIVPLSREVHHMAGRTGGNYLDEKTWLAVGREGHEAIHRNMNLARSKGYVTS